MAMASQNTYSADVVSNETPFSDEETAKEFRTDLRNWRLHAKNGRHEWEYVDNPSGLEQNPQRFLEKYWIGLPADVPKMPQPSRPLQALENGWEFLKGLQTEGGNWGCNCDGPLFVTSGMVFSMYILGFPIESHVKTEMCRYLMNTRNEDGGWGTFIQSPTTVFGTTVNYVMLRMLGLPASHPVLTDVRKLISSLGSALGIATWGKFWLCVLGLYEWDGILPLPAEVLLAPQRLYVNPANWWMPVRNIFISMSYLYGHRFKMQEDDLIREIKKEIYDLPYDEIDWRAQRSNVSETDRLQPRTYIQTATAFALDMFEKWKIPFFRRRALNEALFQIEAEVHNTNYLCLTPVSWASNMICLWHAHGADSHWVRGMKERFIDPMWMCREGLAASGTDGTAVWDTSLSVQAICASGLELRPDSMEVLKNAAKFLEHTQIRENPLGVEHVYRHPSKGGWPFSTRDQGYAVSDTTAEALMALLQLQKVHSIPSISTDRFKQAVDLLLGLESNGGGYAAYEQVRGPEYLELFNITDSYEGCMVEVRYPECTGSVVMALTEFKEDFPKYRAEDIDQCIKRSVSWLLQSQYAHGGWIGSWGVCFSFATQFALQAFACVGWSEKNCEAAKKACAFLLRHQNADGGWGEALESSKAKDYVQEPEGSQVTNTSYAVIGLIAAQCSDHAAIERGVAFIMKIQKRAGDWLPGTLEGIYTPPCGYRYPLYKFHFTLRALGKYVERYGNNKLITDIFEDDSEGTSEPDVQAQLIGGKAPSLGVIDEKAGITVEVGSARSDSPDM